jgi:glutathione S-transferase
MQLYASLTSPYARKLRALAIELGLPMTVTEANPLEDGDALLGANPLGKVPALVTDDGGALVDSPVIAAWLMSRVPDQTLLPAAGPAHWAGRVTEALVDGILDAAIILRFNALQGVTSGVWVDRQFRAIDRALAALPARVAACGDGLTYGALCAVIACEYLDLRWPDIDWRKAQPDLARLHIALQDRPSLAQTRPPR